MIREWINTIAGLLFVGVLCTALEAAPAPNGPARNRESATCPAGCTKYCNGGGSVGRLVGAFDQGSIYSRRYHIKNVHTTGQAERLTHLNYAFFNVQGGTCTIGDAYADYERFYNSGESVDGISDTWATTDLRGNFGQLKALKALHPGLKVLASIGGWAWSGGLGQAALNPTHFANGCYNLIMGLSDPRWAGVFDGANVSWTYPNACGRTCDTSGPDAFVRLLSALKTKPWLVTATVPAGAEKIAAVNYAAGAAFADFYNLMTYDFWGAWDPDGPTAPHAPLYCWPQIPPDPPNYYADYAVNLYLSSGVPASKLNLGVTFYGRGWDKVRKKGPGCRNGLGCAAEGPAVGVYEPGVEDYRTLAAQCPLNHRAAGTGYCYRGGRFWSYDDPALLKAKKTYAAHKGLGGMYCWSLSGDSEGALTAALR